MSECRTAAEEEGACPSEKGSQKGGHKLIWSKLLIFLQKKQFGTSPLLRGVPKRERGRHKQG